MHGTKLLRAALVLSAATGIACAARPVAADTAAKTTKDIEYARVADHSLKLDLYEPAAGKAPLLVWVHGGAWERGSKTPMPLTGLVERGYAVASLDFRPASAARFPGQVHDIKAAIRFLRAAAPRYGYDARRIGILGASSGGHLAALVGTSNGQADLEGTLGDYPQRVLRRPGDRVVLRRVEPDHDPRAVHAVRAWDSQAGAEEPARRASGGRRGRRAPREPDLPRRRERSAAAAAARRPGSADADQSVPRARRASTNAPAWMQS